MNVREGEYRIVKNTTFEERKKFVSVQEQSSIRPICKCKIIKVSNVVAKFRFGVEMGGFEA